MIGGEWQQHEEEVFDDEEDDGKGCAADDRGLSDGKWHMVNMLQMMNKMR